MTIRCRICSSTSLSKRFHSGPFELWHCGSCQFHQIEPKPSDDELQAIYSASYFDKSKYRNRTALTREYNRRLDLMRRAGIKDGQEVLEIGCGIGDFLSHIARTYVASGTDVSREAIAVARRRLPDIAERLTAGPVEKFQAAINSFDAVLMWDVIEHLWDPLDGLKRVAQWLRPGGAIVLSTPDIGALTAKVFGRKWAFMTPPEHLAFFNVRSLSEAAASTGLKVEVSESKGKWADVSFVVYKAERVGLLPRGIANATSALGVARLSCYVPTRDVLYASLRKPGFSNGESHVGRRA